MSWLVDIAGKAESFLNQIDKNAAVALNTSSKQEKDARPKKTEPFLEPNPEEGTRLFPDTTASAIRPPTVSRQNEKLLGNNNSKDSKGKGKAKKSQPKAATASGSESLNLASGLKEVNEEVPSSSKSIVQNGVDKRKNTITGPEKADEEELIAFLNSNEDSGLNESLILKGEVESQARELKLLMKNHRSLQKDYEELKQTLEIHKQKLSKAESTVTSNEAEERDLRTLLKEKEAEICSLSVRHQQALDAIQKLELSHENVQKLEQCSLENSQLKSENEDLRQRSEMLTTQVEAAETHVLSMKTTLSSMEKEFLNYKEKAKSILNYKDELIASLKNDDSTNVHSDVVNGSSNTAEELLAEVTALKNERELLQADLSQTRAVVESLKEDNVRLEKEISTLRCFTEDLSGQLKREKESVSMLQSENLQVCQQLSSLQFELEREKNDRKRNEELVSKLKNTPSGYKLLDSEECSGQNGHVGSDLSEGADKELAKLKIRVNALSQSLYKKQSLINDISTDKQLLQIEVERLKNQLRDCRLENNDFCQMGGGLPQTVIASQPLYLSESPWDSRVSARMKRIYTQLDAVFCQFGLALRKRPNLRLGMSLYIIFLHLWVFFVLFSWMHHAAPPPE